MVKPAALLAVFTFAFTTAYPPPMVAAGESPPAKATKASYGAPDQGSDAQNSSSNFMWLGDFDPPVLQTKLPSGRAAGATPVGPKLLHKVGQANETSNLPPALMGDWDVTSTRTADDTLPEHWTEIQWLFQRNQLTVWHFEKEGAEFNLVTSQPAISKTGHIEHLKPGACGDALAVFNYEYQMNSYKVDSLVILRLSDDKRSFAGTRRITVLERDKHVPCATMQYVLHGIRH